jgi:hypothetical protein
MKKVCLPILSVLIFFACSKPGSGSGTGPSSPPGVLPLAPGDNWIYSKTIYDSGGQSVDTVGADTLEIVSQLSINGITYYQIFWSSFFSFNPSFFINKDSNTLVKVDSGFQYSFFARVTTDSLLVQSWPDTGGRCPGHNDLYAFTPYWNIDGHPQCLKNTVLVTDCTGETFEKWVYYLQPRLGFVRIEDSLIQSNGTFYLRWADDLQQYDISY